MALDIYPGSLVAEDAASADGDMLTRIAARRTDTPANTSGTDLDYEALQMSAGRLWTSATITSMVPGTGATSLGKAEDDAHASGDTGVAVWAVRKDTAASTGADGDYHPLEVDANGRLHAILSSATGTAAAGTAAGSAVLAGGIYNSTYVSLTTGQQASLQLDQRGNLRSSLSGHNQNDPITSRADNAHGVTAVSTASNLSVSSRGTQFNGTSWDLATNNRDTTVIASAAYTATQQSSDQTNYNGRGLHLVIDVTAAAATPSVVFTIQGKDALSGKYYTILASTAITGTGTTVLRVNPGLLASPNLIANDILPRTWRVDATHADSDSITYSVGASVIV